MKRRTADESDDPDSPIEADRTDPKRRRSEDDEYAAAAADLGEDLVFEVLLRADARTLGAAACVSRAWRRMAEDERLWEAACTRHWADLGCAPGQLRGVVLALGGFRRLHARYLRPLLHPRPASAASSSRWGRDELQLSLSLLSIGYFEKMNFKPKPPTGG